VIPACILESIPPCRSAHLEKPITCSAGTPETAPTVAPVNRQLSTSPSRGIPRHHPLPQNPSHPRTCTLLLRPHRDGLSLLLHSWHGWLEVPSPEKLAHIIIAALLVALAFACPGEEGGGRSRECDFA
jgi:hypothetical protein